MMAQVGAICRPQIVLCVLELSTQAPQVHLAGEHAGLAELRCACGIGAVVALAQKR